MKHGGEISPFWYALGVQLLEQQYIDNLKIIQQKHPSDVNRCCTEMIQYWLAEDAEASWEKLIVALKQIGQVALAQVIEEDEGALKGILIVCGIHC